MRNLVIIFFLFCQAVNGQRVITLDDSYVNYRTDGVINLYFTQEYNDKAVSLFSRMNPEPNNSEKFAINRLIDTIDYYGIWNKADIYRGYASNSETSANLNWKSTSFTALPQNSPTFTTYEGYTGNGTDTYIRENYNPSLESDSFQLDNSTIHVYLNSNDLSVNDMITAIYDGTNWIEMFHSTNALRLRLNSSGSTSYTDWSNIRGGITITRDNSTTQKYMRNDGIYLSSSLTSTALPNQSNGLFSLAWNNNGNPSTYNLNTISFIYIGAALTELQSQKLYEAEKLYLDYFNKTPTIVTNEITVDPDGGADYTTIAAALSAITDNSYWNQYNINIEDDTIYEVDLEWKNYVNLIGNDTATAKVIGYIPEDSSQTYIQNTSTIDAQYVNCTFRNVHISIQNGRYAIHSDSGSEESSLSISQNFTDCKIVHEGNDEADTYHSGVVWGTPDAMGMGFSGNMVVNINRCYTESKADYANTSRGIAMHSTTVENDPSKMYISNTICKTGDSYALRIGMLFNNQDEYYFDNVQMYDGGLLIDGAGTYTDNTTQTGTNPIILNGSLIAD